MPRRSIDAYSHLYITLVHGEAAVTGPAIALRGDGILTCWCRAMRHSGFIGEPADFRKSVVSGELNNAFLEGGTRLILNVHCNRVQCGASAAGNYSERNGKGCHTGGACPRVSLCHLSVSAHGIDTSLRASWPRYRSCREPGSWATRRGEDRRFRRRRAGRVPSARAACRSPQARH
jgi:hypothetical protein